LNIVEKLKGGSKAGASEEIESQWGFLKNIINIDKFFDSGTEPGSKSSRTAMLHQTPAKSADLAGKGKKADSAGPAAKEESTKDPKQEKDESSNETKEKTKDEAAGRLD